MGQPNTYQVLVGTSPTAIATSPGGCITVFNLGTTDIFLGSSSVSLTNGIILPGTKGACLKLESCDDWYAIAASPALIAVIVGTPAGLFFLAASSGGSSPACKHFLGGWGEGAWYQQSGSQPRLGIENLNNVVGGVLFHLGAPCTVSSIAWQVGQQGGAGGKGAFGIADLNGNIIFQAGFTSPGGNNSLTIQQAVPSTLIPAGNYYFIFAADATLNGGPYLVSTIVIITAFSQQLMNIDPTFPRFVKFGNLMTGGVMPSPLGSIAPANLGINSMPICMFLSS